MLDKPIITDSPAQRTAVIHLTIPRDQIRHVMGPGITELMSVVKAQGIGPTGPWFTHHHAMLPDTFDFDIGVPVSGPVTPAGRVEAGELRAARVVRSVQRGGYETLEAGWGELMRWVDTQDLRCAPDLWEVYKKGPESGLDPSLWETELNKPLLD
jgi:effector-binding domain-containing protein